jgi:hypothetical protein
MPRELKISVGQHSDKGRKEPIRISRRSGSCRADAEPEGHPSCWRWISSSNVSRVAAESAVKGFLTDYYCTSESWSVRTSAQRVLEATNSWLHSQTRRSQYSYDRDRGYVCTLSAMVVKSTTGASLSYRRSRIYLSLRHHAGATDQRPPHCHLLAAELSRPGARRKSAIEIDYQMLRLEPGDVFVLATDGIYEHLSARRLQRR